jgi:RNA-directed DNA polymerase
MRREIRHWRLQRRSDKTLGDQARMFNNIVQGWMNYYGRYYPSMLHRSLRPINEYLVRWAQRKYKRLRGHAERARRFLADVARREPNLFAHWRLGLRPSAG